MDQQAAYDFIVDTTAGVGNVDTTLIVNSKLVSFGWIDAGNKSATYYIQTGGAWYSAKANFNVSRPSIAAVIKSTDGITINPNGGDEGMQLGDDTVTPLKFGEEFIVTQKIDDKGFPGQVAFVQLINKDLVNELHADGWYHITPMSGLDNHYPYESRWRSTGDFPLEGVDGPTAGLDATAYTTLERTFSVTNWIIYVPGGNNSTTVGDRNFPVPICQADWGFTASAAYNNTTKTWRPGSLGPTYDPDNGKTKDYQETTNYPSWTQVITNGTGTLVQGKGS